MQKNNGHPLRLQPAAGRLTEEAAGQGGNVSGVERWLLRRFLEILGRPAIEVVLWNGETLSLSDEPPTNRLWIHHRGVLPRLLLRPELYFGDAYSRGEVEVEGDLLQFLETTYYAVQHLSIHRPRLRRLQQGLRRSGANSTLGHAQDNIHHHYDIGNDFYALWLDQDMVYTCAYFPDAEASLEEAQQAKMEHVCRKLRLQPGETVVEAGCGWGSLARYMARHYGVRVKAFNISTEQIAYARERASQEGLADQVEFIEDDYRNISGQFDAFVSVGMLEHVGRANYRSLGKVVERCLAPHGRGLIHSIGRNAPEPMNAWIEQRIFPGAYPPTLREMMDILEPWQFSVLDVENLRLHYAKTLEHWLRRYEQAADQVEELFDKSFVRAWRLYLAGSMASFTTGSLQLFQVTFARSQMNDLPWTRAYLYEGTV